MSKYDISLTRGSKFLLRNIDAPDRKAEIKRQLIDQGWVQTYSLKTCDIVITDEEPADDLVAQAQGFNKSVIRFEEAITLSELSSLPELTEELAPDLERRPAFEITESEVRILDIHIPRRAHSSQRAGTPESPHQFEHLCLDQSFLTTARYLLTAARYDIPCVLEGETATAKTTVIRWIAALTGHPVYRINLNGQTDTSELVGRYVPSSGFEEIDTDVLLKHIGEFDQNPEWERIRTDLIEVRESIVRGEPRELNPIEKARIAKTLGLATKAWAFVEGLIPRALRHGAWVILDEMNLAEPQILERLNSVLETDHTLILTEGENVTFGPNADVEVHPDFRIYGTMNPAEYTGRNALSPAFRDRWSMWRFVDLPTEDDLKAMLIHLVFGEHPSFEFQGIIYRAPKSLAAYPILQEVPNIRSLLERLATFHFTLSVFAGNNTQSQGATLGRTRRERYQFTRRGLHAFMKLFAASVRDTLQAEVDHTDLIIQRSLVESLDIIYISKVQETSDRNAIRSAMRAAGLID